MLGMLGTILDYKLELGSTIFNIFPEREIKRLFDHFSLCNLIGQGLEYDSEHTAASVA